MVSESEVITGKWVFVSIFGITGRLGIEGKDDQSTIPNAQSAMIHTKR